MLRFQTSSSGPDDTGEWGRLWADVLRIGDVVRLQGEMGAGKTTLVRAIATGLGADPRVISSPTYVLANEYPISQGHLLHIDAYRLGALDETDSIGLDRLEAVITIVEWADRLHDLPGESAQVEIEIIDELNRALTVHMPDSWRSRPGVERLAEEIVRCPKTDIAVASGDPWYPFATERARLADLYGWMSGSYRLDRPIEPDDDALA